ncbi:hypothetical protein C8F04DRAFT_1180693 [Mycena alexandri]|uniref:Uncharacterized protein n=1 Tax=Mycena alexandri TaxID=1745969 RepID=A0AAD6T0W2_9AGAR|nr:hypothetical protein C8F04DRAFT_1180693 [Mycena alexandri]
MNKGKGKVVATSSSANVRIHGVTRSVNGRASRLNSTLNPKAVREHKKKEQLSEAARLHQLTADQREAEDQMLYLPDFEEDDNDPLADVLTGAARADISHAGGDLDSQQVEEEYGTYTVK